MELLLGIDFGTGGCKVTAMGIDGSVAGEASVEYATHHDHPGWSEQDPADWIAAMREALRRLASAGVRLDDVRAVAADGSTHNAVLLDDEWKPVRRTIMWTDQRSVEECRELREKRGDEIFRTCYQSPAPTWTLPQLMWMRRHEPEAIARTRHVLFVKDYIRLFLTGEAATDRIEAQGTLFYDMEKRDWAPELVEMTGLPLSALPRFAEPAAAAGRVTREAARLTGLPEGAIVATGTSDSAVEDYGAGAVEPGDLVVKLATAGNVNAMTAEAHPHPRTLTYGHVIDGMWYSVSATNAAALCQRWMRDAFYAPGGGATPALWGEMEKEAAASPIGSGGVMFHPYLQGERCPYWDPNLRGSFTGVSISSKRGDFCRALMEGVAFSLRDCQRTLLELGLPAKRVLLIGGGARSALWSQIVADVFNRTALIPEPGDASFGSCLLAGVAAGFYPSPREAVSAALHIRRQVEPDKASAELYDSLFARYRAIHDALAPVYSTADAAGGAK